MKETKQMDRIGPRIKSARTQQGISLRELARRAEVSPSFLSQIENGKSQPSVATLYNFTKQLGIPIDELFEGNGASNAAGVETSTSTTSTTISFPNPSDVWTASEYANRISVVHPAHRASIEAADGVLWERLAATPEKFVNFMRIAYEPGASSTAQSELVTHDGYEYGYMLEGQFEITVGGETFVIHAGESIGFDSTIPHVIKNTGNTVAVGLWFIHGDCR